MSIFRKHKTSADRSASDRSRHKEKIRKAIRDGIHNIVSDESIIGQDGKKKIKIPVRGIKEFRFIYGDNEKNKKVGSAPGKNIKRGQRLGKRKSKQTTEGSKPGNQQGEEFYEVEITLEELSHYLFDKLSLPDLEKKKLKEIVGDKYKRKGYRSEGIRPRLSKKETLKNKIKRKKATIRENSDFDEESFPFHEKDLRYKHIKKTPKENSNAVIFFIMDTSGSMTQQKKFLARSFFFLLYHFLRSKYEKTDIVFISHAVDAKEVNEDDFFKQGSSGGTLISSGLDKTLDIIEKRYHPSHWNIYTFHCSDGDNWPSDNERSISLSLKVKNISQLYCFIQICTTDTAMWNNGGMASNYSTISDSKFRIVEIESADDIWPQFKSIFGGKVDV